MCCAEVFQLQGPCHVASGHVTSALSVLALPFLGRSSVGGEDGARCGADPNLQPTAPGTPGGRGWSPVLVPTCPTFQRVLAVSLSSIPSLGQYSVFQRVGTVSIH